MFSGNKKYYPAKVIMISDDDNALESKAAEVEAEIEKAKQKQTASASGNKRSKRTTAKVVKPGAASVRAIDVAVGARPSIPKDLEAAHKKVQADNREAKESLKRAQLSVDQKLAASVRKSLFQSENDESGAEDAPEGDGEDKAESDENDDCEDDDVDESKKDDRTEDRAEWKWCGCKPCEVLQKYDSPVYHNMLKDLYDLLSLQRGFGKQEPKYLELLPIPSAVKQVELSVGTNVFIAASEKDQLKVDYRNKAASLAKETLFALFGKEVFRTLNVTAIGQKPGTYAIREDVKKAIIGKFIHHSKLLRGGLS
ncbi:hypothetical protein ONE63_003383 [Megalurothrips usitatus]|uniref:Uncharacterized protein n=1 Tax=Megalurothrips usitatus TaxID=439358 RepID=A0AAV7XAN0_9NEOP|nr:hypothetical protein ONE63_003383 [Megalurothrips usitatus]